MPAPVEVIPQSVEGARPARPLQACLGRLCEVLGDGLTASEQ
jgi:hypothetical protein